MYYIITITILPGICEQEDYLKPVNTSSVKTLFHVEKTILYFITAMHIEGD